MYALFFNARGLGDPEKKIFVCNSIKDFKLDFICVQETKKTDFSDAWLNDISGSLTFIWLWEPSKGASGGLLMGVLEDRYEVGSCSTGKF